MIKKKIALLVVLLLLCSSAGFAQSLDTAAYKQTLSYLQGDGVYDTGMMTFLGGLQDSIWTHFDLFIGDAQALAAIFMIIFFGIRSYEMMVGDKQMEIMPLLRPFGLAMIILWWGAFVKMVAFPTDLVANQTEQMFDSVQGTVDGLRFTRAGLMVQIADSLYSYQAQAQVGRFGDMLHPIPWQTDHPFCWHRNAADALAA